LKALWLKTEFFPKGRNSASSLKLRNLPWVSISSLLACPIDFRLSTHNPVSQFPKLNLSIHTQCILLVPVLWRAQGEYIKYFSKLPSKNGIVDS
jgi:hypothetical protein